MVLKIYIQIMCKSRNNNLTLLIHFYFLETWKKFILPLDKAISWQNPV